MAEPTAQQLARQRLAEIYFDKELAKATPGRFGGFKTPLSERVKNRKSVSRYRHTEKGRETNKRSCRNYYHNHPEKVKKLKATYNAVFESKCGVKLNSWLYWKHRLDRGEITPEDVPEKYEKCLTEWRNTNERRIDNTNQD